MSALYAHEIAPEQSESSTSTVDIARYHVARAWGFRIGWMGHGAVVIGDDPIAAALSSERLLTMCSEQMLALVAYAQVGGEADPLVWAHRRQDEDGEWLYEAGLNLGIDMDSIRPYPVREVKA